MPPPAPNELEEDLVERLLADILRFVPPGLSTEAHDGFAEGIRARIRSMGDQLRVGPVTVTMHAPSANVLQALQAAREHTSTRSAATPNATLFDDSTYTRLTHGRNRRPRVRWGSSATNRWPTPSFDPPYRPAREIPLSCQDACRCPFFDWENAIHRLHDHDERFIMQMGQDHRYRVRRLLFGASEFSTMGSQVLVEFRQARALAGIDVSQYDAEITRRVLADPLAWGELGGVMTRAGFVLEVFGACENYVLH